MRTGIIISVVLHVLTLLAFAGGIAATKVPDLPEPKPVPVNILSSSEFTRIKAGSKKVKPKKVIKKAKPKPKKQVQKKKKKKPATVKEATVKKKKVVQKKKAPPKNAKPKPKKKIVKKKTPKPKPKPKKKVVKKKAPPKNARKSNKDFSPDKIAALLNKLPDAKKQEKPTPKPKPIKEPEKKEDKTDGYEYGEDVKLTIDDRDSLIAQISECWEMPIGALGAERIVIKIHMSLNRRGEISGEPVVKDPSNSPFFRIAMEMAIRAVKECQPYKLPLAKYANWKEMILNFDPKEMYRG